VTTIREVAERAEVSIATVSRVLNKVGFVSPDLERRVMEAMRHLNYHPSAPARSLRRQETRTIGVLIPQLDHPFFSALAYAIEKTLFADDYRMLLCSAQEDEVKELAYAEILLRQRVDGLIIVPTGHDTDWLTLFERQQTPVILLDRDVESLRTSRVLVNNHQGGYDGMRHLLERGHRQIAVIGAPAYSPSMQGRMTGAQHALQDYGVTVPDEWRVIGNQTQYDIGVEAAQHLLQLGQRPTAIFALTDVTAVGVMHVAAEMGLKVPQQLSVIGFDDIPLANFMIPSLTTVAQPIQAMGEQAARLVLHHIESADHPIETVVLDTRLVVRHSTQAYPGDKG
jgi:LacI family transcriptional regulator